MTNAVACPKCLETTTPVADTRQSHIFALATVRRRRKCAACGHPFTTQEIPVERMGVVVEMWKAKGDQWRIR